MLCREKVKRCCAERAGCFTYSYLCWSNRVRRYYLKIPPCLYEHCTNVSASYGDPGCCVQLPELTTGTDADRGNGVAGVRTYVLRVRIRSRLRKHRFHTERYILLWLKNSGIIFVVPFFSTYRVPRKRFLPRAKKSGPPPQQKSKLHAVCPLYLFAFLTIYY